MNGSSPMLLLGIGTSGAAIARGVCRAFGGGLRHLLLDTDASTGLPDEPFALIGGNRLSGHGAGGDVVTGRLAAEESMGVLDPHLEGVRLAVIVTSLGGGTGGGATLETAKYLSDKGIPSVVFATTPFTFEGEDRQRNSRGVMAMIEDAASATFFIPLDKLVDGVDNMEEALRRAVGVLASGVTLFWRLVESPGYIRLDTEKLRHVLSGAGRGRFAVVTAQGPDRASEALDRLLDSEMLKASSGTVRATLCGVLAGEDLLLSEVGRIADGVRGAFGGQTFDLATVNDEQTFSGRIAVVVMLFETKAKAADDRPGNVMGKRRRKVRSAMSAAQSGTSRFKNAAPTIWNDEDLDIPTYIRKNLNLEF